VIISAELLRFCVQKLEVQIAKNQKKCMGTQTRMFAINSKPITYAH